MERQTAFVPAVALEAPAPEPEPAGRLVAGPSRSSLRVADQGRFRSGDGDGSHGRTSRRMAAIIPVLPGMRVWLAPGSADMLKGFSSLTLQVQQALGRDPR